MKYLSSRVTSIAIFFAAVALLIIYLLSIRYHVSFHIATFWVAIGLILGIIIYQSTQFELSSSYAKLVLLEIAITCLAFHLIYQIAYYGLRGSDAYMDLASAKGILSSGFVRGAPQYIGGTSYFPMIHILGTQLCLITNIDLLFVAKWFPSLIDVACIFLLYMFIRHIFQNERVALLSALLFASLGHHILFSSLFIRETYALVSTACCIYFYLSAKSSTHPLTYYALSIVSLIATVFAHHLTSFILLLFLLIHFLIVNASKLPLLRRHYLGDNITGEKITGSFVLIAFVSISTYWLSTIMAAPVSPFVNILSFIKVIFVPSLWGASSYQELVTISPTSIQTVRGFVSFYGFVFFYLSLGIILLYGLLPRLRSYRIEALSFTLFLFICGAGALAAMYLVPVGILPYPVRFLNYGWLVAFAPLVAIIFEGKRRWFRNVGILLLVLFMFYNIYGIEPTAWDAGFEEVPAATSKEDYALSNTINFASDEIIAHRNSLYAIYDVHNKLGTDAFSQVERSEDGWFSEYEWIIVHKEALRLEQKYYSIPRTEVIAEMVELEEDVAVDRNRIYESNNLSVFRLRE